MAKRTNEEWLAALRGSGQDRAIGDLRAVLVRGLKVTFGGRVRGLDETAEDFAQDALIKVLNNLDSFRGESRFTTWAQKVAVRVAYTELR
nr:RNA polymerase sigma factor [Actinomycetota bacterium]